MSGTCLQTEVLVLFIFHLAQQQSSRLRHLTIMTPHAVLDPAFRGAGNDDGAGLPGCVFVASIEPVLMACCWSGDLC